MYKARKASLIDPTRMLQLLQLGPESIGASIGELGYRNEMDIYVSRMSVHARSGFGTQFRQ